jgi:CRP/FNR family transcriptional regulator
MSGCLCTRLAGDDVELAAECIGGLWVFEHLGSGERQALVQAAFRKRCQRDDMIFHQGAPAREMFLIKGGRVKLSKVTEDGASMTLDIRKAGDFLGENMLNEDIEYPVSAVCLETTLICGFTKSGFEKLVLDHPNIGLQVIKNLSRRIDRLTSRVGSMSLASLAERLHQVMLQVAREHGRPGPDGYILDMPLTHEDLGFLVGAHRVSITRAMKALTESGRLSREGRLLIVRSEAVQ